MRIVTNDGGYWSTVKSQGTGDILKLRDQDGLWLLHFINNVYYVIRFGEDQAIKAVPETTEVREFDINTIEVTEL